MSYPAKVLLFGEHTVLRGGRGLAVPYPTLSLAWHHGRMDERLLAFHDYLAAKYPDRIDTEGFGHDLSAGRHLAGNIPTGYGLGSSGAVCAAVLDAYGLAAARDLDLTELRELLAGMESYFHGDSSGTDPLVSYLDRPLLLEAGGGVRRVALPEKWPAGFFMVDTGPRERKAADLIARFLSAFDKREEEIIEHWQAPTDAAIEALIDGRGEELYGLFRQISEYQRSAFPEFFPEPYLEYSLKLCGAGGGGMLLGLTDEPERAEATFGDRLRWLR